MRVVTKTDVNIRSGPEMVFDVVGTASKGTAYDAIEYKRDNAKIGWYKIGELGWICEKYLDFSPNTVSSKSLKVEPQRNISLGGVVRDISSVGETIMNGAEALSTADGTVLLGLFNDSDTVGEDVYLARRIFGEPYQLRETEDFRYTAGNDGDLGLSYLQHMAEAPMIAVMPGTTQFLPDLSGQDRDNFAQATLTAIADMGNHVSMPNPIDTSKFFDQADVDIKYFSFRSDYTSYMQYVNTLCWMYAGFLGIMNEIVPGSGGQTYGEFNWANWHLSNAMACRTPNSGFTTTGMQGLEEDIGNAADSIKQTATDMWNHIGAFFGVSSDDDNSDGVGSLIQSFGQDKYYTDFFINPSVSYSESMSNQTKESMLAGALSGASEFSKEISFLLDSGAPMADMDSSKQKLAEMTKKAASMFGNSSGASSLLNRVLRSASTVISGSNIVFPEMWNNSEYSRSVNIEISLKTPYGTVESIYKDIIVPLCHWICLTAPRQITVNTYRGPFLVRCFVPGVFAMDMGIVESLTISRNGSDNSCISVDGLPTQIDLSISIKDLYSNLMISKINNVGITDAYNLLWNNSLIDYIGVHSGLSLRQSDWALKLAVAQQLGKNAYRGAFDTTADKAREALSNANKMRSGGNF